jgi:methanogenic corrinoid protein MtbC1
VAEELINAIAEMQEDEALRLVRLALEQGEDAGRILAACQAAVGIVGDRFESGEYYLPELIMSGQTLRKISEILKPKLMDGSPASAAGAAGKIVLGTVRGDIHDIGKDIVAFVLQVNGYEVIDLGVDVPEERFVEVVREVRPHVLALSGLLTVAYDTMKSTVEALEQAGLREGLKIMVGGGVIDQTVKESTGADGYGRDAAAAVRLAKEWIC